MSTPFYIVFDGMPGPEGPRFIETETKDRKGLGSDVTGGWDNHASEGFARLGPFVKATPLTLAAPDLLELVKELLEEMRIGGIPLSQYQGGTIVRMLEKTRALIAVAEGKRRHRRRHQ